MSVRLRQQRGALSLLWCAVLVAALAAAAMLALMSLRHERNLFADVQASFLKAPVLQQAQQAQQAAVGGAAVRKCMEQGRTVYANVDCPGADPAGRKVELRDSRGIEAPRAPASQQVGHEPVPDLRDSLIERAISR